MLTCQNGRRAISVPLAVEPIVVPVPLAILPVQVQDATVTVRVPKDGSIEEHVGGVTVGGLFPARRDEVLVFPEGLEHLRIEANVPSVLETLQLLFTDDRAFTVLQHRFEIDLGEVHFAELEGTLVFLDDGPAVTDEGDGVESGGAVDGNDLRFADDDTPAVLEEGGEFASCVLRVVDDLLQNGSVDRIPVCIIHQNADGVQNLTRGGLVHLGIS